MTEYHGDVRGVEDLTFAVDRGEIFGFLGPNGAGKLTAIRVLLRLSKPTVGEAYLLGRDVTDHDKLCNAKRHLGYLPSDVTCTIREREVLATAREKECHKTRRCRIRGEPFVFEDRTRSI